MLKLNVEKFETNEKSLSGAAPLRVPQLPWHPSKFSNGCLAPVLKCPWLPKISFLLEIHDI